MSDKRGQMAIRGKRGFFPSILVRCGHAAASARLSAQCVTECCRIRNATGRYMLAWHSHDAH